MDKTKYEYDVEYKEKNGEDWILLDTFDTVEEAKEAIKYEKKRDKRYEVEFDYRIIGKKTITIELNVIE